MRDKVRIGSACMCLLCICKVVQVATFYYTSLLAIMLLLLGVHLLDVRHMW